MKFLLVVGLLCLGAVAFAWRNQLQFVAGGALINAGYRLQDHLADYDLEHHEATATGVWQEFLRQNELAASVRTRFPRSDRHPVIAMVVCMDARLDSNEISGDTRRYYYVLRLAGSALSDKEEDMLELAVDNGVKVVLFTTHSDCAAEKVAKDPEKRKHYPHLATAVDNRESRLKDFLARGPIASRIQKGELLVKWMDLDTRTERAQPHATQ